MTLYLDDVDEHTRYLCTFIDGEYYLITATHTEQAGLAMLDTLEYDYSFAMFELLTDRPSQRLDEYDYDAFLEYHHALIRPTGRSQPTSIKPHLTVIDGGLSQ